MRCLCYLAGCLVGLSWGLLSAGEPTDARSFEHAGVTQAWKQYSDRLTFGKGQTIALVDDGCKLTMPEWSTPVAGVSKVLLADDAAYGDALVENLAPLIVTLMAGYDAFVAPATTRGKTRPWSEAKAPIS